MAQTKTRFRKPSTVDDDDHRSSRLFLSPGEDTKIQLAITNDDGTAQVMSYRILSGYQGRVAE